MVGGLECARGVRRIGKPTFQGQPCDRELRQAPLFQEMTEAFDASPQEMPLKCRTPVCKNSIESALGDGELRRQGPGTFGDRKILAKMNVYESEQARATKPMRPV